MSETLVIGVGNAHRGDDGAGIVAARKIAAQRLPGVRVAEMNGEGTSLVEAWKNSPSVLLVDAVSSGAVPGTIHRFEAQAGPLPTGLEHHSSHSFGVAEAVEVALKAGTGTGCTEAPRGILYHRYRLDDSGTIQDAKIVPPTSQNQKTIESDLREFVAQNIRLPQTELTWQCEQAIRNYDPCISCATHFLKLHIERE